MSDSKPDEASKTYEATQHKLTEARKKGDVPRSADLNTAASYTGFLVACYIFGPVSIDRLGSIFSVFLDQAGDLSEFILGGSSNNATKGIFENLTVSLSGWLFLPIAFVILSTVLQRSFILSPEKLRPKLSRISVIQNSKNKFGRSGWFEFLKSIFKLIFFSSLLFIFISNRLPEMAASIAYDPKLIASLLMKTLTDFIIIVVVISFVVGGVDYLWQRYDHQRNQRMTYEEVKDENKEQEGDPHLKHERRQRATKLAQNRTIDSVKTADVVIVNPTHYAVALKWSRKPKSAPVCVAKGADQIALTIRRIAKEHGVPIRNDPPTARAIYAMTEIDHEISVKQYRAVAAAIRFADLVRKKK